MLYIRTDMNNTIATGHMMRCLSIADAAAKFGKRTTFILADEQAVEIIRERGHETVVLYSKWNDMDAELDTLQKIIEELRISVMLIDSYMVTQNYLSILSERVKTIYLDDLNAFCYPVHALICYAVYWKKFCYHPNYQKAKLLLGLSYVPLREIFCNCEKKVIKTETENLLILSGGTDYFHILERILQRIEKKKYRSIVVICGNYYEDYEMLCGQYKEYEQIHFYKAVKNIEDYMKQADMAVSAGGTTLYELCACGTPTVSYSFTDNQIDNVREFQEEGIIDYAGDVRDTDIFENINRILKRYFRDRVLREERSKRMQKLVDGKGAERIAETLIGMTERE
ncbi:MAG: UDP-2,4-diacetamido-2,4,6-trideoxy-beta-L-altropyranose hydrolase [Dorea sp.]|jgi:UDP-2,4-diacetamido-2,4,6-trideoxy-beta-L-altropyranose hydrolase|nr:UDP-2,4-diacetamido-2,4,6-trideoxy-beta-L-altropyranose hydrolase [Dorea sp.]